MSIEKKKPKKRGRKPKGGKILSLDKKFDNVNNSINSVILHLKCSSESIKTHNFLSDFEYNPKIENIEAFSNTNTTFSEIEFKTPETNTVFKTNSNSQHEKKNTSTENIIATKIKRINQQCSNKKSNCFWCTHPFNNPVVYIPKYIIDNTYDGYGNFCSPPCAVAFLFEEKINTSAKWERYSMLCSLYKEIYKCKNNINPAPNPHYTLSKFLGSLSIEEYRELNKLNNVYTILNKPVTRILPEICESTNNIDIHTRFYKSNPNANNNNNMYRLSRSSSIKESSTNKQSLWKFMK